jgi:hypothetical protein
MPYVKQPISFTVTEWPLSPGSQNFIFSHTRQFQNTGRLLTYLAEELKHAHVLHTYVPFSLVNVWSAISNVSFGYLDRPPYKLYTIPPLVFTFALTKNKRYTGARQSRRPTQRSVIYGKDYRNANDMISIRVPQEILDECKIQNLGIPNLRYLYNVVGSFTKNTLRHSDWLTGPNKEQEFLVSPDLATYKELDIPISTLVKTQAFPYWAYCPTVWTNASNLITDYHINENLFLYYLQFLYNVEPAYGPITAIFGPDKELHKYIRRGLTHICDYWGQSDDPIQDRAAIACGLLIARQLDFPVSEDNLDITVNSFLSSVKQTLLYKQDKSIVASIKGQSYKISLDLLNGIKHDWSGLL